MQVPNLNPALESCNRKREVENIPKFQCHSNSSLVELISGPVRIMHLRNILQINQPDHFRPRSYSRERDDYYARRDHHREREREREGDRYRSERDRYYRERSRSPRTRDRERAEREKYYEVRFVDHRLRDPGSRLPFLLWRGIHATFI